MPSEIRLTGTVLRVLRAFLDDPAEPRYAVPLMRETNLASGTLYQALARMERAGWLTSAMEAIDPAAEGRPARRYFQINPAMVEPARVAVAELHEQLRL